MTKSMDFTNGKILPKLIKFMLPIMLSLLLQALYGAVDLLIVGRFGTNEGISAISNGVETINLFLFLCAGFSSAVTILLGKYIGENKKEKLKDVEIDAYIASSLLRAFKTGAGVCKAKPEKPLLQIMPELIECGVPVGYYGCSETYLQKY